MYEKDENLQLSIILTIFSAFKRQAEHFYHNQKKG
jgi:hypothetical protein